MEASHGSARLDLASGSRLRSYANFKSEWERYIATNETQEFLHQLLPPNITENPVYNYTIPSSPSGDQLVMYDAFMSLALSTCDSARSQGSTFTTSTFHDSFVNQDFVGATGTARLNNDTGSRLSDTSEFVVSNILADGDLNEEGPQRGRTSTRKVWSRFEKAICMSTP